jgi:hypothetical protein
MDMHRDETVTAGELYNRAMISKQDLQAEHAGGGAGRQAAFLCGCCVVCLRVWMPGLSPRPSLPPGLLLLQNPANSTPPPSLPPTSPADVLGVVLNKVPKRDHSVVCSQLAKKLAAAGLPFAGGIPADSTIGTARWVGPELLAVVRAGVGSSVNPAWQAAYLYPVAAGVANAGGPRWRTHFTACTACTASPTTAPAG